MFHRHMHSLFSLTCYAGMAGSFLCSSISALSLLRLLYSTKWERKQRTNSVCVSLLCLVFVLSSSYSCSSLHQVILEVNTTQKKIVLIQSYHSLIRAVGTTCRSLMTTLRVKFFSHRPWRQTLRRSISRIQFLAKPCRRWTSCRSLNCSRMPHHQPSHVP